MATQDAVEKLVPHLRATLSVDWDFPHLRADLDAASARPFEETRAQEVYLAEHDTPAHGGDTAREARYLSALARVRALADAREPLTWARLVEVQAEVLGRPVAFRTGTAFAHSGAHRYLYSPELEEMFIRKVEADAKDDCHPVARAVRLYLDVAFFHPFPDGNARAARLWFEYCLRRERLPTPPLAPWVLLPKPPGDTERYGRLVRLVARSIAGDDCHEGRARDGT
ncbi:Fic family protein [Pyxidicoccus xibeiensis]|uniref:Fic family protein n=1 Tax=Pyxidicoccus xibeiensis TaxID=2906759 RepID=UPI0020A6F597|nr:Fic family protein [Pyxidicoccus xibeiensis]MCP3145188.1 Fic family protein [Pyxidicoccus xibeiensis]